MRCPYCGGLDTQVKDSRPAEESAAIRRRRVCPDCAGRFTTFERVQLRDLVVVKKTGRRAPFDREKLARSLDVALRKRNVDPGRIGDLVMEGLRELDGVAYVRFASVYRNFTEARDFGAIVDELAGDDGESGASGREGAPGEP